MGKEKFEGKEVGGQRKERGGRKVGNCNMYSSRAPNLRCRVNPDLILAVSGLPSHGLMGVSAPAVGHR